MRAIAIVGLLAGSAHASPYVELAGGLVAPLGDSQYTDGADPSLGLAARIGGGAPVGGMFSVEWAPLTSDVDHVSLNRFRFMGHVVIHHAVTPKIELTGRFGAGIDLLHESYDQSIGGLHFQGSDSDLGLALEFGGGAWFGVGGGSTQIGVELAIPIGYHSDDNTPTTADNVNWDFTSFDLEVLGGVRLRL